jgi:hypothetical protein
MQCEICNQEEAIFTIIPTGEGMPQSLGPGCFARSGLEFAKNILPAEEIAAALGPMFVNPGNDGPQEVAKPRRGRKSKAEAAEAEAPEGTAGGKDEIPPAVVNE